MKFTILHTIIIMYAEVLCVYRRTLITRFLLFNVIVALVYHTHSLLQTHCQLSSQPLTLGLLYLSITTTTISASNGCLGLAEEIGECK